MDSQADASQRTSLDSLPEGYFRPIDPTADRNEYQKPGKPKQNAHNPTSRDDPERNGDQNRQNPYLQPIKQEYLHPPETGDYYGESGRDDRYLHLNRNGPPLPPARHTYQRPIRQEYLHAENSEDYSQMGRANAYINTPGEEPYQPPSNYNNHLQGNRLDGSHTYHYIDDDNPRQLRPLPPVPSPTGLSPSGEQTALLHKDRRGSEDNTSLIPVPPWVICLTVVTSVTIILAGVIVVVFFILPAYKGEVTTPIPPLPNITTTTPPPLPPPDIPTEASFVMQCNIASITIDDLCWVYDHMLAVVSYGGQQVNILTINSETKSCSPHVLASGYRAISVACSPSLSGLIYVSAGTSVKIIQLGSDGQKQSEQDWRPRQVGYPGAITVNNDKIIVCAGGPGSPIYMYSSTDKRLLRSVSINNNKDLLWFTYITDQNLFVGSRHKSSQGVVMYNADTNVTHNSPAPEAAGVCGGPGGRAILVSSNYRTPDSISVLDLQGRNHGLLHLKDQQVAQPYSMSLVDRNGQQSLLAVSNTGTGQVNIYSL